jgi:hypothetical protein
MSGALSMTPLAVRNGVFSGATTGRTRIPTISGGFVDSVMEEDRDVIVDVWGSHERVVKRAFLFSLLFAAASVLGDLIFFQLPREIRLFGASFFRVIVTCRATDRTLSPHRKDETVLSLATRAEPHCV